MGVKMWQISGVSRSTFLGSLNPLSYNAGPLLLSDETRVTFVPKSYATVFHDPYCRSLFVHYFRMCLCHLCCHFEV